MQEACLRDSSLSVPLAPKAHVFWSVLPSAVLSFWAWVLPTRFDHSSPPCLGEHGATAATDWSPELSWAWWEGWGLQALTPASRCLIPAPVRLNPPLGVFIPGPRCLVPSINPLPIWSIQARSGSFSKGLWVPSKPGIAAGHSFECPTVRSRPTPEGPDTLPGGHCPVPQADPSLGSGQHLGVYYMGEIRPRKQKRRDYVNACGKSAQKLPDPLLLTLPSFCGALLHATPYRAPGGTQVAPSGFPALPASPSAGAPAPPQRSCRGILGILGT